MAGQTDRAGGGVLQAEGAARAEEGGREAGACLGRPHRGRKVLFLIEIIYTA